MSEIASHLIDTTCLPPSERLAFWKAAVSATHEVTLPADCSPGDFSASARGWNLGQALVIETRSTAQRLWRSPQAVHADQIDHYIIRLQRRGRWTGVVDGSIAEAAPGAVMVLDMAKP